MRLVDVSLSPSVRSVRARKKRRSFLSSGSLNTRERWTSENSFEPVFVAGYKADTTLIVDPDGFCPPTDIAKSRAREATGPRPANFSFVR